MRKSLLSWLLNPPLRDINPIMSIWCFIQNSQIKQRDLALSSAQGTYHDRSRQEEKSTPSWWDTINHQGETKRGSKRNPYVIEFNYPMDGSSTVYNSLRGDLPIAKGTPIHATWSTKIRRNTCTSPMWHLNISRIDRGKKSNNSSKST